MANRHSEEPGSWWTTSWSKWRPASLGRRSSKSGAATCLRKPLRKQFDWRARRSAIIPPSMQRRNTCSNELLLDHSRRKHPRWAAPSAGSVTDRGATDWSGHRPQGSEGRGDRRSLYGGSATPRSSRVTQVSICPSTVIEATVWWWRVWDSTRSPRSSAASCATRTMIVSRSEWAASFGFRTPAWPCGARVHKLLFTPPGPRPYSALGACT